MAESSPRNLFLLNRAGIPTASHRVFRQMYVCIQQVVYNFHNVRHTAYTINADLTFEQNVRLNRKKYGD